MAENRDGQERTERATPRRLEQARKRGQVPRSRELNTMLILVASAAGLLTMGDRVVAHMAAIVRSGLSLERELIFDPNGAIQVMERSLFAALELLLPFLVITTVAAVAASVALGGWSFSIQALAPRLEKLDPVKGMKRLFSARGLMELAKALAKFALVGAAGLLLLRLHWGELVGIGGESVAGALAHAGHLLGWSFLILSLVLLLVAAADVPFQLWEHGRQLRMTRQEVKDETKDTEGRPEVRSRIRQLQREQAQRRMMEAVAEADVVVTNPTHFAVALKYDSDTMRAPRVVAKGADLVAAQIRARAEEHGVPMLSAPPLARALYYSTELEQEIPAGLYFAVAQVLAWVYQIRTANAGPGETPPSPPDVEVPAEFLKPDRQRRDH